MSELTLKCPYCGIPISADESELGTVIICPACSTEMQAPTVAPEGSRSIMKLVSRLRPEQIPVSSSVLHGSHKVLGMVCFSIGTRGGMVKEFVRLKKAYSSGQVIRGAVVNVETIGALDAVLAGYTFRSDDIEIAFGIAVSQLQFRAYDLGGNAIIGFRWDVGFDSNATVFNHFFGIAYGTVIHITTDETFG